VISINQCFTFLNCVRLTVVICSFVTYIVSGLLGVLWGWCSRQWEEAIFLILKLSHFDFLKLLHFPFTNYDIVWYFLFTNTELDLKFVLVVALFVSKKLMAFKLCLSVILMHSLLAYFVMITYLNGSSFEFDAQASLCFGIWLVFCMA